MSSIKHSSFARTLLSSFIGTAIRLPHTTTWIRILPNLESNPKLWLLSVRPTAEPSRSWNFVKLPELSWLDVEGKSTFWACVFDATQLTSFSLLPLNVAITSSSLSSESRSIALSLRRFFFVDATSSVKIFRFFCLKMILISIYFDLDKAFFA